MSSPYGVVLNDGVNILRKPLVEEPDPPVEGQSTPAVAPMSLAVDGLTVVSIDPGTGQAGDLVTLTIEGLVEDAEEGYVVTFSTEDVHQDDWMSVDWESGIVVLLAPANPDGPVDVTVSGSDAQVVVSDGFTYTSD